MNATNKKRILFACYDFRIGGHSSHTLNFAREFRRRGHIVGALVPEPFGDLYPVYAEALNDVRIVRRGIESRAHYVRRITSEINRWSPDVLINNAVPFVQAALPLLPLHIIRISVAHSIVEIEATVANSCYLDCIVAVSENIRDLLEARKNANTNIATIPVGLEAPSAMRGRVKTLLPLRLIYVGRIEPEKNLPGLFRVLSELDAIEIPFSMSIVGTGRQLSSVQKTASKLRCARHIRFLGARTPTEVSKLFNEHDFLLLTSHYEGTPHAVLEAMAHGLVVLVSRIPGATDRIIADGVDGFLCDKDRADEYVRILRTVATQPIAFDRISSAARNRAVVQYGAASLAEEYETLFKQPNPVRHQTSAESAQQYSRIPNALLPHFPGIAWQLKHRVADEWRRMMYGQEPTRLR